MAYENDVGEVEQVLKNAAGSVEIVHKERGIDVRLGTFTRDKMIFRIGWWMKDNDDYYKLRQLVNQAVVKELKGSDIVDPYRQDRVDLETDSGRDVSPGKWEGGSQ